MVQSSSPTWWFATVCNSRSKGSDDILTSKGTRRVRGTHTYIHTGKTLVYRTVFLNHQSLKYGR